MTPASYAVLIDMKMKHNGASSSSRMGNYHSLEEAKRQIAHNESECVRLNLNFATRSYRIFKAEWTEITE
jgi:hypothetical protein